MQWLLSPIPLMASASTGTGGSTKKHYHSNIHPKHPFARQGQSVFKLDNIAPGSGFKSRISTSCAECKRLKIKCLKTDSINQTSSAAQTSQVISFPCLTCIKRGCEAICPQGVLVPSDTSKTHGPSDTSRPSIIPHSQIQLKILEHQNSITALKRRVHELENALQDAHAKVSDDTHPLLHLGDSRFGLDLSIPRLSHYDRQARHHSQKPSKHGELRPRQNDNNETVEDGQSLARSLIDTTQNASERRDKSPRREEEPDILTRALGLLSIKEDGRSTYHAQNAGAWYYLVVRLLSTLFFLPKFTRKHAKNEDVKPNSQHTDASTNFAPSNNIMKPLSLSAILTPDILYASRMFPMGGIDDADISSEILLRIRSYIPDYDEAMKLVDIYYAHSSWLYDPISRSHFMAAIFNVIYPFSSTTSSSPKSHPHPPSYSLTLATFFVILAIGTHLDTDQPCGSPGTNVYYHLARAAVASDRGANPVHQSANTEVVGTPQAESGVETGMPACLLDPGLDIVRILLLMSYYLHMSDARMGYGGSWALMGLATKLATGIGLHRDPTKWKLDPPETRLRQDLFWELYTYDSWLSMPSGRPPSFLRIAIDLKRPYEHLLEKYSASNNPHSAKIDRDEILDIYKAWKHQFCFVKLVPTVEQAWGAQKPSYYTVLVLDRVLREQLENIPSLLRLPSLKSSSDIPAVSGSDPHSSYIPLEQYGLDWKTRTCLVMQRYTTFFLSQVALLLLHRPYFVHAMNTSDQPLMTKFAASVLAVYRSSCSLIARGVELYALEPRLSPRIWYFWAQVFSAVTCLGGLVVRSPNLSIASSALANIEMACDLFGKIKDSNRTVRALPTMLKLRDRARLVYNAYQNQLARRSKPRETGLNDRQSQYQNEGQFGDSGPEMPVPVLKEEEEDEIAALVGETRLVDQRTGKSRMYPRPHSSSNVQSQSSSEMSRTALAPASSASLADVPGPAAYLYHETQNFNSTFESGLWFQHNQIRTELSGDQKMSSAFQQTPQDTQPFDPLSLFRELGLDIATPGASNSEAVAATDKTFFGTDLLSQPPPELYDPAQFQLSNQNWIESLVKSGQDQVGLPYSNVDMNTNIDQSQDTDAALEDFIAQVMRGYTSGSVDINSNSTGNGQDAGINGINRVFASDQALDQNYNTGWSSGLAQITPGSVSLDSFPSNPQFYADMPWTSTNVVGWQMFDGASASALSRERR